MRSDGFLYAQLHETKHSTLFNAAISRWRHYAICWIRNSGSVILNRHAGQHYVDGTAAGAASHARLDKVSFIKCRLRAVNFDRAAGELRRADTETQKLSFRAARLTACASQRRRRCRRRISARDAEPVQFAPNAVAAGLLSAVRASITVTRRNPAERGRFPSGQRQRQPVHSQRFVPANLRDAIAAILQNACCQAPTCRAPICSGPTVAVAGGRATRLDGAYTAVVKTLPRHNGKEV